MARGETARPGPDRVMPVQLIHVNQNAGRTGAVAAEAGISLLSPWREPANGGEDASEVMQAYIPGPYGILQEPQQRAQRYATGRRERRAQRRNVHG